eukprot:9292928-Pyramimonas_sp.AAC.1
MATKRVLKPTVSNESSSSVTSASTSASAASSSEPTMKHIGKMIKAKRAEQALKKAKEKKTM